jgi:hypothetical protein
VQLHAIKEERQAYAIHKATKRLAVDSCRYHTVKKGPQCSGVLHQYALLVAADLTDTGDSNSDSSVQLDWNVHKSSDYSRRKAVLDRLIALVGR